MRNALLLIGAATTMVCIWMLPLLLMGQMYDIHPMLLARDFAESGMFATTDALGRFLAPHLLPQLGVLTAEDGRLSAFFFAKLSRWIAWTNLLGWSAVAASTIALALIALWYAVAAYFEKKIAWVTICITAFMPLYWRQAVWLDNYNFAFLFLFLSFAAFSLLYRRSHWLALAVSGVFFGLSVASKDAFLVFVPWYAIAYAWMHRGMWKKAVLGLAIFFGCTGVMYLLPYTGDILTQGYPTNYNLAFFWPGANDIRESFYLHLYPDPYTYNFDRTWYDQQLLTRYHAASVLEQLRLQKIFINFHVGNPGFFVQLINGIWLFVGSIPPLFQLHTVGGVFLWLFTLPGVFLLWKRDRRFVLLALGLILSSEFGMRFILHYSRDHSMDYGWILALFAAFGVVELATFLQRTLRVRSLSALSILLLILSLTLVQANRVVFARNYLHSPVPAMLAAAAQVAGLPDTAVIAAGIGATKSEQLAQLSGHTVVPFDPATVDRLLEEGKVEEVFLQYGVTHLYGYDTMRRSAVQTQLPHVESIDVFPLPTAAVSSGLNFLLHIVR